MKRFCRYTVLQLKRAGGYLPYVLAVTAVLCACLALALVAIVKTDSESEANTRFSIGIVGDPGDVYLNLGLSALKSLDSSRFSLDLVEIGEEEAKKALQTREIGGYAVIPQDFIESAIYGDVGRITFVTNSVGGDMVNMFKQELLRLVSCILVESQKGVYGASAAMKEIGAPSAERGRQTDMMMLEYIGLILNRSNTIEVEVTGISEELTLGGYMFTGVAMLFMLLSGIVMSPLYIRRDMSLCKLLRANGYAPLMQITGEYLSLLGLAAANMAVMAAVLALGADKISAVIPELGGQSVGEILLLTARFLPAAALVAAMQYLMYQLADTLVSGALMQFICAVFLGYLSGCFYPISFFPPFMRILSLFIPSGLARAYMSSVLTNTLSAAELLGTLGYFVCLMGASLAVRRFRIQRG